MGTIVSTTIVGAILSVIVVLIVYSMVKDRKNGKSQCGGDCSKCGGHCH